VTAASTAVPRLRNGSVVWEAPAAAPVVQSARQRVSRELEDSRFSRSEMWGASRASNYNERRGLQGIEGLPKSVRLCGTVSRRAGGVELKRNVETGRAHYQGECYCGSVTGCAVCRGVKMSQWAAILVCHLDALRDRGGAECLLTFTIPHRRDTELGKLHRVLRRAYRETFSGAGWAAIAKQYGYLGSARVLETTWSPFAGHHPHIHHLAFFAKSLGDLAPMRAALQSRFTRLLYKHAAREGYEIPPVDPERAVSLQHANNAGQYITKIGLAEELTSPGTKTGREVHGVRHLTMPQVARRLAFARLRYGARGPRDRERDARRFAADTRVFLEYVGAMRGQQIFRVAPGLAAAINALPLRPDVVPEFSTVAGVPGDEEPPEMESLYYWLPAAHRKFRACGPLARVEVERVVEEELWPAEGVGWLIDRMVSGRWRPREDVLWGEDADSPLFTEEDDDDDAGKVLPLRAATDAGDRGGVGHLPGDGVRDATLLQYEVPGRLVARSRTRRGARPGGTPAVTAQVELWA
jgi:hypothetical protein